MASNFCLEFKSGELKWRRQPLQINFLPFVTGWHTILHKILSLINVKEKNVLVRSKLHWKEGRHNEESDSSSFAELGSLVRMND
jgi:hypothetical protein